MEVLIIFEHLMPPIDIRIFAEEEKAVLWIVPNSDDEPEAITLLDGEMKIRVFFEIPEEDYKDNVHLSLSEDCPEERALLRGDEVAFSMTSQEARKLAQRLVQAADQNDA
jgi:hypothetical protein